MFGESKNLKKLFRPLVSRFGLTGQAKNFFNEFRLSGERLKFTFSGRPGPEDAIILAGSGRSGTTWLSNIISSSPGIQTIFEPLNPSHVEEARLLVPVNYIGPYQYLYYLRSKDNHPEWHIFLQRALTGKVRNYWTDFARTSFLPNRFLIKSIRANLMLGFIDQNFHPQIIYITRHPCAAVLSRLMRGWHADVTDLLEQEALVEDYLSPWINKISAVKEPLEIHAVWWSVENAVALDQLSNCEYLLVTYEELVLRPEETATRIQEWLGLKSPSSLQRLIDEPSRHSRPDKDYGSKEDRLTRWQRKLTADEQKTILCWSQHFGVDLYDDQILPTKSRKDIELHEIDSSV